MNRNPHNQFLRQEAPGENPNLGGETFAARLEKFASTPQEPEGAPVTPPAVEPVSTPVAPPAVPAEAAPVEGEAEPEDSVSFPEIGTTPSEGEKPTAGFDETSFDAQTEALIKSLEAKGHPGDVYKNLRQELKTLKKEQAVPNLDTIPEVKVLRERAAEAETLKAEAEALRQRNQELLQVNDQVAIRESQEWKQAIDKPISDMDDLLAVVAESSKIDIKVLHAVIQEEDVAKQDKMLDDLQLKLGSRMVGRIERLADDYKAITAKGIEMLSNPTANREKIELARREEANKERQQKVQAFRSATEASFESYGKAVPGFVDSSGNLTDEAKAVMAKASSLDPLTLSSSDLGFMAFAANALPGLRKANAELRRENSILKGSSQKGKILEGTPSAPREESERPMTLSERMAGQNFTFAGG